MLSWLSESKTKSFFKGDNLLVEGSKNLSKYPVPNMPTLLRLAKISSLDFFKILTYLSTVVPSLGFLNSKKLEARDKNSTAKLFNCSYD